MFSKLRSLIFKIDPETAHNLAIKSLKLNLLPSIYDKNKKDNIFQTSLFGKNIDNPIGIAAGFDKNAEVYNSLLKLGFGFVEVGTVTPLEQYGNPKPRIFRLEEDEALINRLGFNNKGIKNIKERLKSKPPTGLLGINIGPNKESKDRVNDYLLGFRAFHNIVDYITINISSPNTENLTDLHEISKLEKLLQVIDLEKENLKSTTPIVLKISPDISKDQAIGISEVLLKHEIGAIIISNTSVGHRESLKSILKNQKGGLSGKPIEKKSNQLINIFYNLLKGKIIIIGVGGVDSGESAHEKLLSGASFIQLYTGLVYQGPSIVLKIKKELKKILLKDGIKNYKEVIGKKIIV